MGRKKILSHVTKMVETKFFSVLVTLNAKMNPSVSTQMSVLQHITKCRMLAWCYMSQYGLT